MQLTCRLIPKNRMVKRQLVARLEALGFKPRVEENCVSLDYTGNFNKEAMTIISVFDSFGCDRAIICKDWGCDNDEGQRS